jgi:hypothetical protein
MKTFNEWYKENYSKIIEPGLPVVYQVTLKKFSKIVWDAALASRPLDKVDTDRCANCEIKHVVPANIIERVCKACKQNPTHDWS